MTERERLKELFRQAEEKCDGMKQCEGCVGFGEGADCIDYLIVDHLLANGVIVLPVKIGQTVYDYAGRECVVFGIHFFYEGINSFATERIGYNGCRIHTTHSFDKIDETVFLAREDAEKALKEREGKT